MSGNKAPGAILDIGGSNVTSIKAILERTLLNEPRKQDNGITVRCIPGPVMYEDEKGFDLWCELNNSMEWYHGRMEIELLQRFSEEMAARIPAGTKLFDLGSG
jgi:uncharacterized SAM-dependent methyltransferase